MIDSSLSRLRKPARRYAQALVVVAISVALAACGKPSVDRDAAVPVIAGPVHVVSHSLAERFPGEVHAAHEMPLSFRVSGQLKARYVQPGERVKQGQVLAQLDPSDMDKQMAAAKASWDAAEHRLVFATQQRDRDEAQFKQNLISQLQLQQTQDAYASALAGRNQARQQYELAQNQRRYTTLVADHDGVITSRQADVGQVLAAGQAVFGFAWSGQREAYIDVPESRIDGFTLGQTATVTLPALPGSIFTAHVREIAPAADAPSRTYLVKLAIERPGDALQLGMTVDVAMHAGDLAGTTIAIPATALFHQGDHPAVWVIRARDGRLELRRVTVARYGERDVFIAAGLRTGEQIVMQGVHAVSAGEKVAAVAPPHAEDAPQ